MSEEGTTTTAAPEGGAANGAAAPAAGGSQAAARTFTQEDVDKMIGQRLSKFSDYEALKARAAKADEFEAAQGTETDKLRTKAEREAEKRADAVKKAEEATTRANNALMRAAVVSAASQLNAADPGDVFTLLDKSELTVDEDTGDVTGAKEAVEQLLKAKPHLLKRAAGSGFDGGALGSSTTQQPDMNRLIRSAAGFGGQ
jgi:hypothetical protein